jgi:hypothetical protein
MANAAEKVEKVQIDRGREAISCHGFSSRFDKRGAYGCLFWHCIAERSCQSRERMDDEDPIAIHRKIYSTVIRRTKSTLREDRDMIARGRGNFSAANHL